MGFDSPARNHAIEMQNCIIQRLGDMSRNGSVVHINGVCFERRETLEPIAKEHFNRIVLHRHKELVAWDPLCLKGH